MTATGTIAKVARVGALALLIATGKVVIDPGTAAAATGTVTGGTAANCWTNQLDGLAGVAHRQINANFPTGTTNGYVGLKPRVEVRSAYSDGWHAAAFRFGTSTFYSTPYRLPLGQFSFSTGGGWYRTLAATFDEPVLSMSLQARVAFVVTFPDGHYSWAFSKWVNCY